MEEIPGLVFQEFKTFGKQSYRVGQHFTIPIHLLMFGSYSIDEQTRPTNSAAFENGDLYFYSCSVKLLDVSVLKKIDWNANVLSDD